LNIKDLPFSAQLDAAIARGRDSLAHLQQPEGSWCFELESDATIPAEYILMMHFMGKLDVVRQEKMACYLRAIQRLGTHGAWDLYVDGAPDISCSVKAYFALKAAGDAADAPHMVRARETILELGGAAKPDQLYCIALRDRSGDGGNQCIDRLSGLSLTRACLAGNGIDQFLPVHCVS
jgi:squalene-hopene/tetraprenyl-beta-curcumene cyclase